MALQWTLTLAVGISFSLEAQGTVVNLNDTWIYGIPSNAVLFWKDLNPHLSPS